MKPKDSMFASDAERYQLQLRQVTSESHQQTLWDRSGAGRKAALRMVLLEQSPGRGGYKVDATRH